MTRRDGPSCWAYWRIGGVVMNSRTGLTVGALVAIIIGVLVALGMLR
jgi:hypothetical protein